MYMYMHVYMHIYSTCTTHAHVHSTCTVHVQHRVCIITMYQYINNNIQVIVDKCRDTKVGGGGGVLESRSPPLNFGLINQGGGLKYPRILIF